MGKRRLGKGRDNYLQKVGGLLRVRGISRVLGSLGEKKH